MSGVLPMQLEPLWTADDLAAYLKCSRSSVYQRTAPGAKFPIPCLRLGGLLRFDPAVIREWVQGVMPRSAPVLSLTRAK